MSMCMLGLPVRKLLLHRLNQSNPCISIPTHYISTLNPWNACISIPISSINTLDPSNVCISIPISSISRLDPWNACISIPISSISRLNPSSACISIQTWSINPGPRNEMHYNALFCGNFVSLNMWYFEQYMVTNGLVLDLCMIIELRCDVGMHFLHVCNNRFYRLRV